MGTHRSRAAVPWLLALFFTLWSFRGPGGNPVDTDAARHVMNGVFLHDFVRDGHYTHPLDYARSYYSRYPAISLPYHPPLFPLFESVLFLGLGVNWLAARIGVALATAAAALLLYRLLSASYRARVMPVCATAAFFLLPGAQRVAGDVMLEMPALALALAAAWFLRDLDGGYPLRRGLAFALLAGAAVWTKQNTLFLGAVPFAWALIAWRPRLLAGKTIWISSAIFAAMVAALAGFSTLSGLAGNSRWPRRGLMETVAHNAGFYGFSMREDLGLPAALWIGFAFVVLLVTARRGGATLYLAWAASALGLLLVLPPYDARYLFFVYPALMAIGVEVLLRAGQALLGARGWLAPAAVTAVWAAVHLGAPPNFLEGPAQAARVVVTDGSPGRVLYCGRTNGAFIFAVRSLDPRQRAVVIRGDKLPPSTFGRAEFEEFAHRYGITHIVLEQRAAKREWDVLFQSPSPNMQLVREIVQLSSDRDLNGQLRVYRFTNPSPHPESTLKLRTMSGRALEVEF